MTDPVRPVAPREDVLQEIEQRLSSLKLNRKMAEQMWGEKTGGHTYAADERFLLSVRELLAAAPVPCAASPADLMAIVAKWERRADHGFDPEESETSYAYWQGVRAVCAELRATGEGARDDTFRRDADPVSGGAEVDGARVGPADRHQHRDVEPDRARAHDGRGHDAEAVDVAAQQAAPLAVSLDPHRLQGLVDRYAAAARVISLHLREFCDDYLPYDEMIAQAARKVAEELESNRACNLSTWRVRAEKAEAELARLRGEAAVRPLLSANEILKWMLDRGISPDDPRFSIVTESIPATVRVEE